MQCSSNGQSASVFDQCTSAEYCDAASSTCKPRVCTPSQPACDGDIATTCNALGSGYASGGTDCAASGKACSAGMCTSCPGGTGVQDSVRLVEVHVGDEDYVILRNTHPTCSTDLQGMEIDFYDDGVSFLVTLPTYTLAPGQEVYVTEPDGFQTGDIQAQDNILWAGGRSGHALLCTGACSTVTNVIDGMAFDSLVGLPPPVTMTPGPVSGITVSNQETHAWKRVAFSGSYPTFAASDWSLEAASRPSDPDTGNCPATQPGNGSTCTEFGASCNYGATNCICFTTWTCT